MPEQPESRGIPILGPDHLRAYYLQDRNATVAEVRVGDVVATGSAKREPGEKFDAEVGRRLAVARAMHAAAAELHARALARLVELSPPAEPVVPPAEWKADLGRGLQGFMAQINALFATPTVQAAARLGREIQRQRSHEERHAAWLAKHAEDDVPAGVFRAGGTVPGGMVPPVGETLDLGRVHGIWPLDPRAPRG